MLSKRITLVSLSLAAALLVAHANRQAPEGTGPQTSEAGAPGEDEPSAAGAPLTLHATTSHPEVLAGGEQDVYLHVTVQASAAPLTARAPLNLALVIDRSGSMAEERKLEFAKQAAAQLADRLAPEDRFSVVAYDSLVETIVPSRMANAAAPYRATLANLQASGQTNLHGGMLTGVEQVLAHFAPERSNRVLLLSDGLANVGVRDPASILESVRSCREKGVRISTMGMGLSYDDTLMSSIAQESGGKYYYVDDAEFIGLHLDRELEQLSSIVARDVDLRVELAEGVRLVHVFGQPALQVEGSLRLRFRDLVREEQRRLVIQLRVRGESGQQGQLARVKLAYTDAGPGAQRLAADSTVEHRFTQDTQQVSRAIRSDVLQRVEVLRNAEALLAAMRLKKQGDLDGAIVLLLRRSEASRTEIAGHTPTEELERILKRMHQVILDLERTRSDPSAGRDLQLATELSALGYVE